MPRGQADDIYSARKEKSEEKPSPDIRLSEEIRDEQAGRNRQGVQSVIRHEEGSSNKNRTESNSGAEHGITAVTREVTMKEAVVMFDTGVDAERIKQGDCETEPEIVSLKVHLTRIACKFKIKIEILVLG